MKRIDILATKIRNCITDFLSQTDISEIKGNIYLFNGDKEINISISEVWEIAEEVSLEDKELGGYYDQVKSTLPEKIPVRITIHSLIFFLIYAMILI